MSDFIEYTVWGALGLHILVTLVCVWRVWRGENTIDRLVALDVLTTLVLIIFVLIAILEKESMYIDVAIGLAALSAIATIAMAKFIADQRMF